MTLNELITNLNSQTWSYVAKPDPGKVWANLDRQIVSTSFVVTLDNGEVITVQPE